MPGAKTTRSQPVIVHVVHSLSVGGMERGLLSFLAQPAALAVRNVVCTMRGPGTLAKELPANTELDALGYVGRHPLSAIGLSKVLRRHRPEVVHARNFNTWCDCVLACRLTQSPKPKAVLGFHGLETDGGFTPVQRRRARWLGFASHQFTSVSRAGADQLTRELGVDEQNIRWLANGVDTSRFTPPDARQKQRKREALGIDPSERVVLMVGSLVPVKDHAAAIDAVKHHIGPIQPVRLLIVGDGRLRDEIREQADHVGRGTRVTLLGERHDIPEILRAADVFALSSRSEQMSSALTEAMATGIAVVATDVGDSARVVEHRHSGLIVPPANPAALGHALAELLANPDDRRRLGANARRRAVERFDLAAAAHAYTRYYESLANDVVRGGSRCAALPA